MITTLLTIAASLPVSLPAASFDDPPAVITEEKLPASTTLKLKVEPVVTNVEVPWTILFTPDGRMMFTERPGRVRVMKDGKLDPKPMLQVSVFKQPAENGLMGMCLHPDYEKNKFVYISYGTSEDIRVVRYTEKDGELTEPKVIASGFPSGGNHAGCRIHFGPDKKLYISTGEKFQKNLAQDMSSLGGKILRVNDDGTIPQDNPFTSDEWKAKKARPEIWALGVRNPQGFDWQDGTGKMFETEHGPSGEAGSGGDEFNTIAKGDNMGWPTVHHADSKSGFVSPLVQWSKGIAPSDSRFYKADAIPSLKGAYLVAGLKGNCLLAIHLDGNKVTSQETLLKGYGRLRAICVGPDGAIYVSTSNKDGRGNAKDADDQILKITLDK